MLPHPLTAVIVISGRGSNMQRLIEAQKDYRIIGVASDRPSAPGLLVAQDAKIPTFSVDRASENPPLTVAAQKDKLWSWIKAQAPDLVLLAGYMQIVPAEWIAEFPRKIVNIHPALLPALPGLHTHARAIAERHTLHGASVHIVDAGIDTGEVIAQAALEIKLSDDEHSLAARVLSLEHQLYPWVVRSIANHSIILKPKLSFSEVAVSAAQQLGFILPSLGK